MDKDAKFVALNGTMVRTIKADDERLTADGVWASIPGLAIALKISAASIVAAADEAALPIMRVAGPVPAYVPVESLTALAEEIEKAIDKRKAALTEFRESDFQQRALGAWGIVDGDRRRDAHLQWAIDELKRRNGDERDLDLVVMVLESLLERFRMDVRRFRRRV